MPNEDRYHSVVLRCLQKAGWKILKEQEYVSIGTHHETNRRLFIDIKAQNDSGEIVLVEVKGLEQSPVHELMVMLGQYLTYRIALDYLSIDIPLYVAIPVPAYNGIIQHVLGQEVMNRYAISLLVFDPIKEEIDQWMSQP